MLVFWEAKLVFLATPKAGSTAIQVALESLASVAVDRPAALKHTSARDYYRHVAPWLEARSGDHFQTVALMREPISWLKSWYRFQYQDALDDQEPYLQSFDTFAAHYAKEIASGAGNIGTQSDFLTAGDGKKVDRIFCYEEMDAFTQFLEDSLDCVINLPRINVPRSADVSVSEQTENMLRDILATDIKLYQSLKSAL